MKSIFLALTLFAVSGFAQLPKQTPDDKVNSAIRLSEMAVFDARLVNALDLVSEARFENDNLTGVHRLRLMVQRYRVRGFRTILYLEPVDQQRKLEDLSNFAETAANMQAGLPKAEYQLAFASALRANGRTSQAEKLEIQTQKMLEGIGEVDRSFQIRASAISRKHNALLRDGKKAEIIALIPQYEQEIELSRIYSRYAASYNTRHLAQIHRRQTGDYKKALELFKESLELREAIGFRPFIPASVASIGDVYVKLGETDKAIDEYKRAVEEAQKIGFTRYEFDPLLKIGDIYSARGDKKQALAYYQLALAVAVLREYKPGVEEANKKIGEAGKD